MKRTIAVYPGSFDPVTNGHLDIIRRASGIFGGLLVAVLNNPSKVTTFSSKERMEMLRDAVAGIRGIEVRTFTGLLVTFMEQQKAKVVVRGLRFVSDYEYELQMALMNKSMSDGIETFFMAARPERTFVSSSLVKEISRAGRDVTPYVPKSVADRLAKKLKRRSR